jgi:hypothetical protein
MLHKSLLTLATLIFVLVALHAEARDCKPLQMDMGPPAQPAQYHAERVAIHTWERHVLELHGKDFADWEKAQSKKISCEQFGEYHQCWIEGRPCR